MMDRSEMKKGGIQRWSAWRQIQIYIKKNWVSFNDQDYAGKDEYEKKERRKEARTRR